MDSLKQVLGLMEADTPDSFAKIVDLLEGTTPLKDERRVVEAFSTPAVPAPLLMKALARSRVREKIGYTAEAKHPFDYRTRCFVERLLYSLGKQRHEPARAILEELLDHPAHEITVNAAHGLNGFGDAASANALLARVGRPADASTLHVAIRGVLKQDPQHGYDRLIALLEPGIRGKDRSDRAVLWETFAVLCGDYQWNEKTKSTLPVSGFLDGDPRFIALALRTQRDAVHPELRSLARDVVKAADKEKVKTARKELKSTGAPAPKAKLVRPTKASREESLVRMRSRMSQVLGELQRIERMLREGGYVFLRPHAVIIPPSKGTTTKLKALEKRCGALPTAVRAFFETVGAVDFRGSHPDFERSASLELPGAKEPAWLTDPLVVASVDDVVAESEEWEPDEDASMTVPFRATLVPEPLSKAGFSAGPGYAVVCGSNAAEDPRLEDDPAERTFLQHLERAVTWGGLPGFETLTPPPKKLLRKLGVLGP